MHETTAGGISAFRLRDLDKFYISFFSSRPTAELRVLLELSGGGSCESIQTQTARSLKIQLRVNVFSHLIYAAGISRQFNSI